MAPGKRKTLGNWGEELAAKYLQERGLSVVARNVFTPYGEIDLVAKKDDVFVFVEVKTRSNFSYGYPEEALTGKKQTHLVESAQYYIQENAQDDTCWQIDVIAIHRKPGTESPEVIWYENAVN